MNEPADPRSTAANRLGALALAVNDLVVDAVRGTPGHNPNDVSALIVVDTTPGVSIGRLARVLRLTHSGAVRLVDRLEAAGHVDRVQGDDGRTVRLRTTDAGRDHLAEVLGARHTTLGDLVEDLGDDEIDLLDRLASRLLARTSTDVDRAHAICRLCETRVCVPYDCPVEAGCAAHLAAQPGPADDDA